MNTITLDNALYKDAATIARLSNISVSDVARLGIQMFINQFRAKTKVSSSAEVIDNKKIILQELSDLANLEANWDGYGAIPVLKDCITNAMSIVSDKAINADYIEDIAPNPNGTLTITWQKNGNQICLEVGKNTMSYFAEFNGCTNYSQIENVSTSNINKLANYVNQL